MLALEVLAHLLWAQSRLSLAHRYYMLYFALLSVIRAIGESNTEDVLRYLVRLSYVSNQPLSVLLAMTPAMLEVIVQELVNIKREEESALRKYSSSLDATTKIR